MWIYLTTWYIPCIVNMKQKQAIHQENVQNHFKMENKDHAKCQITRNAHWSKKKSEETTS